MKYKGDSLKTCGDMISQSWEFGKAIRPLFAEPVTNVEYYRGCSNKINVRGLIEEWIIQCCKAFGCT